MNVNRNTEFCKILRFWKGNKKPLSLGQAREKGDKIRYYVCDFNDFHIILRL